MELLKQLIYPFGNKMRFDAVSHAARPAPELQQQLEQLSQLPKAKQRLVSEVLDSLIAQNSR